MAIEPHAPWILIPATLAAVLALATVVSVVPDLFDPCHDWGVESGGSGTRVELDDDCPSRSGTSQTRAGAVFQLAAIHGVLLLAAGALVLGSLRADGTWTAAGATLLLVLVPPFGLGIFWIPLAITAIALFMEATRSPPGKPSSWLSHPGLAYVVAGIGIILVAAFLWTEGAAPLAAVAGALGLVGLGVTVRLSRRRPDTNPG